MRMLVYLSTFRRNSIAVVNSSLTTLMYTHKRKLTAHTKKNNNLTKIYYIKTVILNTKTIVRFLL